MLYYPLSLSSPPPISVQYKFYISLSLLLLVHLFSDPLSRAGHFRLAVASCLAQSSSQLLDVVNGGLVRSVSSLVVHFFS